MQLFTSRQGIFIVKKRNALLFKSSECVKLLNVLKRSLFYSFIWSKYSKLVILSNTTAILKPLILIHFVMQCIHMMGKLNFQQPLHFNVTRSFRPHSNVDVLLKKHFWQWSMMKTDVLLNICVELWYMLFSGTAFILKKLKH